MTGSGVEIESNMKFQTLSRHQWELYSPWWGERIEQHEFHINQMDLSLCCSISGELSEMSLTYDINFKGCALYYALFAHPSRRHNEEIAGEYILINQLKNTESYSIL